MRVCTCQFKPYNTSDKLKNILEMNEKKRYIADFKNKILHEFKESPINRRFAAD